MQYSEEDLLMLSALQHYIFCPRQCALIHTEQAWEDNRLTAEGRIMHERVHEEGNESRNALKIVRGLPLRSLRLGLVGIADVVEFHLTDGVWQPYPVEYKRGKPKPDHSDAVQLCAQAICLEEMLSVRIPEGALYYGRTHRRQQVLLDDALRAEVEAAARGAHELLASGQTPEPVYGKRCESCSLVAGCMPRAVARGKSVSRYLSAMLRET